MRRNGLLLLAVYTWLMLCVPVPGFDGVVRMGWTGTTAGNPTATSRNITRLRKMPNGDSVLGLKFVLHVWAECSWKHLDNSGNVVNRHDARKLSGVEHDSAKHRYCASANTTATTACGERNVVLSTNVDNGHHFICVFRAADGMRLARRFTGEGPMHSERPPVAAMFGAVGIIHRCGTRLFQLLEY